MISKKKAIKFPIISDLGGANTSREVVDNILRHLELEHVHW